MTNSEIDATYQRNQRGFQALGYTRKKFGEVVNQLDAAPATALDPPARRREMISWLVAKGCDPRELDVLSDADLARLVDQVKAEAAGKQSGGAPHRLMPNTGGTTYMAEDPRLTTVRKYAEANRAALAVCGRTPAWMVDMAARRLAKDPTLTEDQLLGRRN